MTNIDDKLLAAGSHCQFDGLYSEFQGFGSLLQANFNQF
jgi:hypothetical protein